MPYQRPNFMIVMSDEHAPQVSSPYGLITFFDTQLGRLLDALEASGQAENTVVIYVADHGEMHGEHGMWWKCSFYEHSARIPTVISWPGHFKVGQRVPQVVSLIDVVRKIVELAGATEGDGLDGDSLVPLLHGNAAGWKDLALVEYEGHGTITPARMVRRGRYKLNYYRGEPPELYDLVEDPNELDNLAGRRDDRALQEELTALVLADWNPTEIDCRVRESQQRRKTLGRGNPLPPAREWTPDL